MNPITTPTPDVDDAAPSANDERPSFWDELMRLERARQGRLRSLWQMSVEQRIAAMRRGQLTYEQLAAWSARYPEQIPRINDEFEWIAIKMPEVCE